MKKGSHAVPDLFGRADMIVYLLVILAALVPIAFQNTREAPQRVMITYADITEEYPLSEDRTLAFESNGISLTVVIKDGAVYVESSDCRDGLCKDMGSISKTGQIIICAPATLAIRIEGDTEVGYDAVVR